MMTETKDKSGIFYGWRVVFGCFFIYGFGALINYTFTIYAPFILKEMNWTRAHFGNISTVFLLVVLVMGVATGWFIDKYGPKLSILIGSVVGALGMVLFSTTQSMTQAYIYFAGIISIGVAMQMALPTQTLARRWFLKRAALATGTLMSSFGLIGAIFFPLFAKMATAYGWRSMVMWSGIIIEAFIFLLALFLIKDSPESMGLHMDGMSDEEAKVILGGVGKALADEPHMTRGEALKAPQFWIVAISLSLAILVFTGFLFNATLIGLSVGMTAAQAALVMSAWALPSVIGRFGGGWTADKLGKRKAFMLFGFLIAIGYTYAWLFASSPTPLYIFAIWSGIVMSPILVIVPPFFGDLFGRLHLASILGLFGLVIGIVGGLGPLVAGRIAEATNSYQLLYLFGAVANVLFVIMTLFVKPTRVEQEMSKPKAASGA
jgi:OFA family oxalate/formate antiporter-like MFS transporter